MNSSDDTSKQRAAIALMELRHLEEISRVEEEFNLIFEGLPSTNTIKPSKQFSIPISSNQHLNKYSNSLTHTPTNSLRKIDSKDLGDQFKKLFGKTFQFNSQNRFVTLHRRFKSKLIAGIENILSWLKN